MAKKKTRPSPLTLQRQNRKLRQALDKLQSENCDLVHHAKRMLELLPVIGRATGIALNHAEQGIAHELEANCPSPVVNGGMIGDTPSFRKDLGH